MALPLGKLTILVGAGILGSVLAKEGRLPDVSDIFSGAFKIALKQIRRDDSNSKQVSKPRNDSLMAQVNSLREELQMLASSRPITIVTASGGGASRYGIVIVIVVLGSGYIWWKGWKLPDMMFATRRGLSDACTSVAQQLETVYSSIRGTKRQLSSNIDHVNSSLDEVVELTATTKVEVTCIRDKSEKINHNVQSVSEAVKTLGKRIYQIEGKQGMTLEGVKKLCDYAQDLENNLIEENIQALSSNSRIMSSSKIASLPPSSEPSSPGVSLLAKTKLLLPNATSETSGEQGASGLSGVIEVPSSSGISNGVRSSEGAVNGSSSSSWWRQTFLSRSRSATNAVLQQNELNNRQ